MPSVEPALQQPGAAAQASLMLEPSTPALPVGRRAGRQVGVPAGAIVAIAGFGLLVLVALFAPLLAPHDPQQTIRGAVLHAPSTSYPFGTDDLGRDELSRVMYGARVSLRVGLLTTLGALSAGTLLALVASLGPRLLDMLIMRLVDVLLAFPGLLLALSVVAALGPSLTHALIAVAASLMPGYVRTVRALILGVRQREFVVAARSMGATRTRIALRHVLPNIAGGLLVLATLGTALVTLEVSALSFIGLGAQPPQAEWGSMLATARTYVDSAWWLAVFPAVALTLTILSVNVIGDWLRDVVDPRAAR
jgi:ABC-type dipeptide/oligopeptide/nickel transport system permease subunit